MQHLTRPCPFQPSERTDHSASFDGKLGLGLADRAILSLGQPPSGEINRKPHFSSVQYAGLSFLRCSWLIRLFLLPLGLVLSKMPMQASTET